MLSFIVKVAFYTMSKGLAVEEIVLRQKPIIQENNRNLDYFSSYILLKTFIGLSF
jgi:hypothetical protein